MWYTFWDTCSGCFAPDRVHNCTAKTELMGSRGSASECWLTPKFCSKKRSGPHPWLAGVLPNPIPIRVFGLSGDLWPDVSWCICLLC